MWFIIVPCIIIAAIVIGVVVWKAWEHDERQRRLHAERMWWHNRFWSIVNSINWNDDLDNR